VPFRAMDAAWWSSDGEPARWGPNWDGFSHGRLYTGTVAAGWLRLGFSVGTNGNGTTIFFQAPFSVGGAGEGQQADDHVDVGFFYLQEIDTP